MAFKKGDPKPESSGRKPGSPNKLTRTVREVFLEVFNELQNDPNANLVAFAKKYPRDFYPLASKLIPTEITGAVKQVIKISIKKADEQPGDSD